MRCGFALCLQSRFPHYSAGSVHGLAATIEGRLAESSARLIRQRPFVT